jgi:nicotinamidase-related amidase
MLGAIDHALVPPLFEAALYHALVRDAPTRLESKGYHPLTENYSVLEPEVKALGELSVGKFNQALFELLDSHDRIYVFGEAASHCVLATLESLRRELQGRGPASVSKLYVLEDCTSPVPAVTDAGGVPLDGLDFPRIARSALEDLAAAGVNVVKSTDPW